MPQCDASELAARVRCAVLALRRQPVRVERAHAHDLHLVELGHVTQGTSGVGRRVPVREAEVAGADVVADLLRQVGGETLEVGVCPRAESVECLVEVAAELVSKACDLRVRVVDELRDLPVLEVRLKPPLAEDAVDLVAQERRFAALQHRFQLGHELVEAMLEPVEPLAVGHAVEVVHAPDHEREPALPVAQVERAQEAHLRVVRLAVRLEQLRSVGPREQRAAHEERLGRCRRIAEDLRDRRRHPFDHGQELEAKVGLEPEGIRADRVAVSLPVGCVVVEREQRLDRGEHLVLDGADHLLDPPNALVVEHQLVERVADRLAARELRQPRPDGRAESRRRAGRALLRVARVGLDEEEPAVDLGGGRFAGDRAHGVPKREVVEHPAVDEERRLDGRARELIRPAELRGELLTRLLMPDVGEPGCGKRAGEAGRRARGEREGRVVVAVEVAGAVAVEELEDVLVDDRVDRGWIGDRQLPVVPVDVGRRDEQVERQPGRHQ